MKKYFLMPLLACLTLTFTNCEHDCECPIDSARGGDVNVDVQLTGSLSCNWVNFTDTVIYKSNSTFVTVKFGVKSQSVQEVNFSDNALGEELILPLPIHRSTQYDISSFNDTIEYKVWWENNEVVYKCYRDNNSGRMESSYSSHYNI